ncbi:MAG: Crp/Fnr family transcriptional regulator [Actinomycetota bacterium]
MQRSHSSVLDALGAAERRRLWARSVTRSLRRGESLHLAGERAGRVHLVRDGVLKLSARNAAGGEAILGLAVPGQLVGEVPALDGGAHPLDAIAVVSSAVTGFPVDLFVEVVERSPSAAVELARRAAARERWLVDAVVERSVAEVPARLAGRLLDLADLLGSVKEGAVELDLPLDQDDLGRLAGMCRESACRTLRRFKARGVVDYRGRTLRILRPDVLEKIRCAGRAGALSR